MKDTSNELCVAIDGGTTNTRARLLHDGDLVAVGARAVGARDVAIRGSADCLRQAVAECVAEAIRSAAVRLDDVGLFCASGMLTSNLGLQEVPHVAAPMGLTELAKQVVSKSFPEIAPRPIHLIPGIKSQPVSATLENLPLLDIMRGEECEAFGILETRDRPRPVYILLPGSHTKLMLIDDQSRISMSYTTVAGELMQALAQHTIVASSIDWPPEGETVWDAVESGTQFVRDWGLARGAFAVRLADVLVHSDRTFRTWFYVGLVVANDWAELSRWSGLSEGGTLLVGGREPLRGVYGRLAKTVVRADVQVLDRSLVELAAARGAIAVARCYANKGEVRTGKGREDEGLSWDREGWGRIIKGKIINGQNHEQRG